MKKIAAAKTTTNVSQTSESKIRMRIWPYLLVLITSVGLYINTIGHQYALDDNMTIISNDYVQQGLGGMKDIFTKDMLDAYYRHMNAGGRLSGGRFRPLSIASFALEQEIIGTRKSGEFKSSEWDKNKNGIQDKEEDVYRDGIYDAKDAMARGFGMRHFITILLYGICVCIIFYYLSHIVFARQILLSFIITLVFAAHPIHTEVVANVKSRDEILSLLFIIATLIGAHSYYKSGRPKDLILTSAGFLLALFSKEYGITLFILLPLSLYLFEKPVSGFGKPAYLRLLGAMVAVFGVYMLMRLQVGPFFKVDAGVESEVLNNPYLQATTSEAFATKVTVLLKYLWLLIWPDPLISDYGFNSIKYHSLASPFFLAAGVIYTAMAFLFFYYIKKRNWLAFPIGFYLGHLALVSNLIGFNLGATMGERLIFHSSLGYSMVLGYAIYSLWKNDKTRVVGQVLLGVLLLVYSTITISRNLDWENDDRLFLSDVVKQPESIALNNNASAVCLFLTNAADSEEKKNEYINNAKKYAHKALSLQPNYVNALINYSICYGKMNRADSAEYYLTKADSLYPTHPLVKELKKSLATTFHSNALQYTAKNDFGAAIPLLEKAYFYNKENVKILYDLGVCYYNTGDPAKAVSYFSKGYALDPKDADIQRILPLIGKEPD